jgi:hypothetical protein
MSWTIRRRTCRNHISTIATYAGSRQFWRSDADEGHFAICFGRIFGLTV